MPTQSIPDDALVVRGGQNSPSSFAQGSGVKTEADGKLQEVSVNSAPGLSLEELTAPAPNTGYPGIPHNQVGVTTAGEVRRAGGDVVSSPTRGNPNHATLSGLTPDQAAELFQPTRINPSRRARRTE